MSRADRFLRACRGLPVDTTPVWIMRQAGRYLPEYQAVRSRVGFLELCKRPDLATEVTLQPVDRLGVDAAILFSDILIPVEAMGAPVIMGDAGPSLPEPVRDESAIDRLRVLEPESVGFVLDAVRMIRAALSDQVPLIGFSGAPFTLASYLVEGGGSKSFIEIKRLMFQRPELAHRLLDKLAKSMGRYLAAQVGAGAQVVQIFDSWAGVLAPEDYETFALPYTRQVIEALPAPRVPVIIFGTETAGLLERLRDTGADVVGVDWRIEIDVARARLGPGVPVQGNLDPCALFLPREHLARRVEDVLRRAGPSGHIFNLGHGILPPTPVDSAIAMVDIVHERGRARASQ
ncbi:MAG: uroporphyrinogen decarboxylase [Deltaproteobacteria bacterium]|nr:uroporphyrinogen decarboxylase [Deltaproteobacteria bacterium]